MTTTIKQKSILSLIPQDTSNIIKDFLVEERQVIPLKINSYCANYYITNYKGGYKIDKRLSLVKFEKDNKTTSQERKEQIINKIQKSIKRKYPIFLDEEENIIQYFYNMFYDEYNTDDEDDNPEETNCVSISVSGCKTFCCVRDFERKIKLYIGMIGKVYKKL
jgi:hypothetical protein